jgi:hypothetical protein
MSFNFSKDGETVATIIGGAMDKKNVYIDKDLNTEDNEYVKSFTKIELPKISKFQQTPRSDFQREAYYISGKAGSGKSHYTEQLVKQIRKHHKEFPIVVFSPLEDNYGSFDNLKRINLENEELIKDPIKYMELSNSIVIFDDVEAVTNKDILKSIMKTLTEILFIGRHENIYVFYISHESCAGSKTKPILTESNSITAFPQYGFDRNMKYLFEEYWGLSKNEIEFVKSRKSRWATYYKIFPTYFMFEHEMYTKNELEILADEYCRKKKVEEKAKYKSELSEAVKKDKKMVTIKGKKNI